MSNNLFDKINEMTDKQRKDWEKIDGLINVLEQFELSAENEAMFKLLVLLANQIRPVGQSQMVDVEKELESIMSNFSDILGKRK